MAMGTSLNIQDLRTLRPDGGWNAARLPHGPAGNPAEVHGLTWFIFEDSQQPDAAWEVIKFFSSEEALRIAVESRGTLVPHRSLAQMWVDLPELPHSRHVFIESLANARGIPAVADGEPLTVIQNGVFAVVEGTESVTQVIENWKTALNAWIQQDRQQGSSPAR